MYGVIYLIRNLINGKCYIGKTINLKRRIYEHFMGHSEGCKLLSRAIKKYGKENFSVEILHEGIIPELLDEFEIQAIKEHNTKAPRGYNLTDGGEGLSGFVFPKDSKTFSAETKRKRSESVRKTFTESPEIWFEAQRKATEVAAEKNKGKPRPAEIREKISIGHRKSDYSENA